MTEELTKEGQIIYIHATLEASIQFVAKWAHDHGLNDAMGDSHPNVIGMRQVQNMRKALEMLENMKEV